jgi:hypothetical protein
LLSFWIFIEYTCSHPDEAAEQGKNLDDARKDMGGLPMTRRYVLTDSMRHFAYCTT